MLDPFSLKFSELVQWSPYLISSIIYLPYCTLQLKKVEEGLKLVGVPSKEQFDAITVKVEQVYKEWSAEASGQIPIREKIVSDFDQFLKTIDGCESESCVVQAHVVW